MDNTALNIVRNILDKFQEGYTKRDITIIDSFMDELFINSSNTVILGTSNGELCCGFDPAKDLIKSDWEYWGDVRLDTENPLVQSFNGCLWFAVHGTVKQTFRTNDDTFERYVNFVKGKLDTARMSPAEGLTAISWGLSHFLFPRTPEERSYGWPIRLTGALIQEQDVWKIQYLQFSLPCSTFPDERIGTDALDSMYSNPSFMAENFVQGKHSDEILSVINEFTKEFSAGNMDGSLKHFKADSSSFLIAPQEPWHVGKDAINDGLKAIYDRWGMMNIDTDHSLVFENKTSAWVIGSGEIDQTTENDRALSLQVKDIENIVSSDMSARQKLFNIQRNINATYKEIASGTLRRWPCRFEALLSNDGLSWSIHSMQLSFPFAWILEDKLDAVRL